MSSIIIKDLNFGYKDNKIFTNFNLEIEDNKITSILGANGSGKSTLVKILTGLISANGYIKIEDKLLIKENIKEIRKIIGVVFENPDNQFVAETVMDDIAFTLENMNYKKEDIRAKIEEMAMFLDIKDILEENPNNLSGGKKQLVALASALIHEPKILILDEALTYIDKKHVDKITKLLLDLKKKGLTIINITHDIEETLISDNIILLDKGQILYNGSKENFYKQDIKKIGINPPFIVDLSERLIFYNLIDKIYYDMEMLVNDLWK